VGEKKKDPISVCIGENFKEVSEVKRFLFQDPTAS
jgi:hypothetical protein